MKAGRFWLIVVADESHFLDRVLEGLADIARIIELRPGLTESVPEDIRSRLV